LKNLSLSARRGEDSPFWKGGIDNNPYPDAFNKTLKRKIRKKYNYICQVCGENVYGSIFGHVHHIDGNKLNNNINNLVIVSNREHRLLEQQLKECGYIFLKNGLIRFDNHNKKYLIDSSFMSQYSMNRSG